MQYREQRNVLAVDLFYFRYKYLDFDSQIKVKLLNNSESAVAK